IAVAQCPFEVCLSDQRAVGVEFVQCGVKGNQQGEDWRRVIPTIDRPNLANEAHAPEALDNPTTFDLLLAINPACGFLPASIGAIGFGAADTLHLGAAMRAMAEGLEHQATSLLIPCSCRARASAISERRRAV